MSKTLNAQEIINARIKGETILTIAQKLQCSIADVQDALDWHTRQTLTKHLRANTLAVELERLDKMQRRFEAQTEEGDCHSAIVCLKIMERRQILLGLAAPPRVDPQLIELQIKPATTSTERIREALDHLRESPAPEDE